MRLAAFILKNIEPILVEWEAFARTLSPHGTMEKLELRDHAADILRAAAIDMKSAQTATEQSDKSKGSGATGSGSDRIDGASIVHAIGRVESGFDLVGVIAEYRALRASVVRLWRESDPDPEEFDLEDLTRFNESIDQSLTEAVRSYTERVEQSRQMFLAILGHDLRNPLNSISMSAQMLPRIATLDDTAMQTANRIVSSADAMAKMIGDLLDFTGIGVGAAMPLSRAPMDLRKVAIEVVEEVRSAHPSRTLNIHIEGDLTGSWDSARLRQVISNLLGNAVQHGTGPIDVHARGDASDIHISVRNGGTPIPQESFATLFDPLVRGTSPEAQAKRRPGSIGLGLFIARAVAKAHGGDVDVTSSAKDGTAFAICLPRDGATAPVAGS